MRLESHVDVTQDCLQGQESRDEAQCVTGSECHVRLFLVGGTVSRSSSTPLASGPSLDSETPALARWARLLAHPDGPATSG